MIHRFRHLLSSIFCLLCLSSVHADQVIMKDGKIYQGRIMGETPKSILLSRPNQPPKFLPMNEVMTIVREKNPEMENPDRDRQIHLALSLGGVFSNSGQMEISPAPALDLSGAFRLHPKIQIEGGLDWLPDRSGELAITDGATLRRYERFYSWGGGFGLRLYPIAKHWQHVWEPFVLGGFRWTRLIPKDSGDHLKGHAWNAGLGLARRLRKNLAWETRLLYSNASYGTIQFLSREGDLRQDIEVRSWTVATGLSLRL